ncbi:MAG: hypothetical protein LBO21_02190 [Synergistaceae bacterium]|jgi:hypothetical protein|nr:hypothetical protein [Synergistaceae bacterium]
MTVIIISAALVLAAFLPRETKDWGFFRPRGAVSFACALFSSLALPWSGVPVIHSAGVGSWAWFPSAAAVILSVLVKHDVPHGVSAKVFLIASVAVSAVSMSRFMDSSGVPGSLCSIEGLSMVARLCGPGGLGIAAGTAVGMIAAGLFFSFASFASVCRADASFSVMSFSFSGFWVITFIPLDLSGLAPTPRHSAVLAPVMLFAASCAVRFVFVKLAAKRRLGPSLDRNRSSSASLAKFLPLALTASGSIILTIL